MIDQTGNVMAEKLYEEVIKCRNQQINSSIPTDDINQQTFYDNSSTILYSAKL